MNAQITLDTLAELRGKLDALEVTARGELAAGLAQVAEIAAPVVEAVEAPAPVVEVPADAAMPVAAQDIEKLHAKVDGLAAALITAIQRVDAKVDAGLDVADAWALHPKVAAAAAGGTLATVAAYVAQLTNVNVDGGATTGAGVAALVAVIAGWLKRA